MNQRIFLLLCILALFSFETLAKNFRGNDSDSSDFSDDDDEIDQIEDPKKLGFLLENEVIFSFKNFPTIIF